MSKYKLVNESIEPRSPYENVILEFIEAYGQQQHNRGDFSVRVEVEGRSAMTIYSGLKKWMERHGVNEGSLGYTIKLKRLKGAVYLAVEDSVYPWE